MTNTTENRGNIEKVYKDQEYINIENSSRTKVIYYYYQDKNTISIPPVITKEIQKIWRIMEKANIVSLNIDRFD